MGDGSSVAADATERRRKASPSRGLTGFAVGLTALALGFCFDLLVRPAGEPLAFGLDPSGLDWLFAFSWLAFGTLVVWPLAARPRMTRAYWQRLRSNRLAVASLAYLGVFLAVGTVGPWLVEPDLNLAHAHQPPVLFDVAAGRVYECLGPVVDGQCHGTWRYPLGTNSTGKSVVALLVSGMRVSLLVALVSATILVPVGVTIGVVAGYLGGWVDTLLMGYVDVQQTLPAFVLYLILIFVLEKSLLLIVLVFGLTSWGGTARMVRSEVLQRREEGYVTAAQNAGASHWHVVRKHVLPNVSSTVATAMSRQIPVFLLTEAAIAYLKLNDFLLMSWGEMMALELRKGFPTMWWSSTLAVTLLAVTVISFSVLGDALRDVLDPKESG